MAETKRAPDCQEPNGELYTIRRIPGRKRWAYATLEQSLRYEKYSLPIKADQANILGKTAQEPQRNQARLDCQKETTPDKTPPQ